MMQIKEQKHLDCQLCGGKEAVRQIDWEAGALSPVALCDVCRSELLAALAVEAAKARGASRLQVSPTAALSPAAEAVQREASTLTEAAFEEKYLTHPIDRVLFEYIRGYGQADMDGEGSGMVVLIMDGTASMEEVTAHLSALSARGIVYPVPGRVGWYGADYAFCDD